MKLTHHISSDYMTAANALRPSTARRRIVAYVESYDDIFFWRTVLGQYENDRQYFEIMLPTKSGERRQLIGRGKRSAIGCLINHTGRDMIACVDADYDYLMQRHTESSRLLLDTPYVFHTFSYAIENLQCYAPGLHNLCVMVTLNDRRLFDFEAFLSDYSRAVWRLFCWSVALYRHDRYDLMTITDMDQIITPGKLNVDNAAHCISRVRSKAQQKEAQLRRQCPDIARTMSAVASDLQRLGVHPETTYLYLHGHHLFEKVVLPLVNSVCTRLVRDREQEIHRQAVHSTQMRNELSCYSNSVAAITPMMKKNAMYVMSPEFKRISAQIQQAFSDNKDAKENAKEAEKVEKAVKAGTAVKAERADKADHAAAIQKRTN